MFKDFLSDKDSFEATDAGKELYEVFLQYQFLLRQGLRDGSIDRAREYQAGVIRKGIGAIKLKDHVANTQHSARGRGSESGGKGHGSQRSSRPHKISGPKEGRRQVETHVQHPDAGLARFTVMEAHVQNSQNRQETLL